jgi:hypothetical protein
MDYACKTKQIDSWYQTTTVVATLLNVNRTKRQKPADPTKLHPLANEIRRRRRRSLTPEQNLKNWKEFLSFCKPPEDKNGSR